MTFRPLHLPSRLSPQTSSHSSSQSTSTSSSYSSVFADGHVEPGHRSAIVRALVCSYLIDEPRALDLDDIVYDALSNDPRVDIQGVLIDAGIPIEWIESARCKLSTREVLEDMKRTFARAHAAVAVHTHAALEMMRKPEAFVHSTAVINALALHKIR